MKSLKSKSGNVPQTWSNPIMENFKVPSKAQKLDFNKMLWKFITMYDDTDMHNWVMYHTNLKNRVFKIPLIEYRNYYSINERFKIRIMDCLVKLWIVFSLYIERFHHSTKEVTGYEFENIMGNSYKFIFQLLEIMNQIWISINDSYTVIHQYSWIMDIHQTYMINMKCKYFMVLQKLQSDPCKKMVHFHSKINFVKLSILMPCINKLYLSTLCRLMHRSQQVSDYQLIYSN